MRLRELLWTVAFLVGDRDKDERQSCALLTAAVVVLGIVAMAALAAPVLREWAR